jgi:predicted MFS family arabinose efflux permease
VSELLNRPSRSTLAGLDWLNFFLADVQTGVGPFLAIYLAGKGWNEQSVGMALTVGGLAGIITQTPMGALVDRARAKRTLVAAAILALACGALLIAFFPNYWIVMAAQTLIGGTSSIFVPLICAISLGIVGTKLFDCRQGRNQAFNAAGNAAAAVSMGLIGYYLSDRGIFFFVVALSIPTLFCLRWINPEEIDYEVARNAGAGGDGGDGKGRPAGVWQLLKDRPLVIFCAARCSSTSRTRRCCRCWARCFRREKGMRR